VLFDQLPEPIDLELDRANRVLYWTDRGDPPRGNTVNRAPIDKKAAIREGFATELASGQLRLIQGVAGSENIQSLIDPAALGSEVDYLGVDIDLQTSHIFRAIQTRPRAACIEYNAHFPPIVEYESSYREGAFWNGSNVFGASLKTLEVIGREKGLSLVGCDLHGVNAYFVANKLTGDHFVEPFTAEHHYQSPRFPFVHGQRGHRRLMPNE
jgi:hypothetical protein